MPGCIRRGLLVFAVVVLICQSAWTDACYADYTKAIRYGYTYAHFPESNGEIGGVKGHGLSYRVEYGLTQNFQLGISMTFRQLWDLEEGQANSSQLGYGLIMQHYLDGIIDDSSVDTSNLNRWRYFTSYGLLMQVIRIAERGAGTAHDTRFGVGADFPVFGALGFMEIAYHYSVISYFEQPKLRSHYVEVAAGFLVHLGLK